MDIRFPTTDDQLPRAADPERVALGFEHWQERLARLGDAEAAEATALAELETGRAVLSTLFAHSPFLTQAVLNDIPFLSDLLRRGPDACLAGVMEEVTTALSRELDQPRVMRGLRIARRRVALLTGLADISGHWQLDQVTAALSDFADAALNAGLSHLLRATAARGNLELADPDSPLDDCGYVVLAMGKLGAGELNYSSDVDLIVLYDRDRVRYTGARGVQEGMVRLTRDLMRLLDERTADGYVCRTDLRLRPDPGATPLAIPATAALSYYESIGQNWERAAMIKARPVAGDLALGRWFLGELRPFVWRKHLDFWAIQDIHSIKRQIYAHKGGAEIAVEGHNVKLGRGGIREIEFFAQTQQLIFGGRDPSLRPPRTVEALAALAEAGRVKPETAAELSESYRYLRGLEHRLQMVDDHQTHNLPDRPDDVDRIGVFMGCRDSAEFRRDLLAHLRRVEDHYAELFEESPSLSGPGNLVFTGGEAEPGTLDTLERLGFADGSRVFNMVRAWHHGRYRATRSTRSRELLTELMPTLLQEMSKTRDPDRALTKFDAFLAGLPAGVQLFSMLYQNPALLEMLGEIMGRAPALADQLSSRPGLLEAVLTADFFEPLPAADLLRKELAERLRQARDFQDTLDLARRWAADRRFQAGVQILRHTADVKTASRALSDIADNAVYGLLAPVEREFAAIHGSLPGAGMAVVALGKLGAREMTVSSDLDLVFLYEVPTETIESDGRKPLAPSVYFGRLAQRLIAALSAPTGEGQLYEIDSRLRPSGSAGPIALSLKGFERYQTEDAWTWEHMALTRARVVAGEPAFAERIERSIRTVLTAPRDPDKLLIEVADMRRRIAKEFPGQSPWDAKYRPGGLYHLDFIAQYLQLRHAAEHPDLLCPHSEDAFGRLAEADLLPRETAAALQRASRLWRSVQSYLRLTVGERFDEEAAPEGLKQALARAGDALDFSSLKDSLTESGARVAAIYDEIIATPAQRLGEAGAADKPEPSQ